MNLDAPIVDYLKRCPSCGESKMVTEGFGWRILSGRRYAISFCRQCHRLRRRPNGSWIRSTEPRLPAQEGFARCSDCGETKLIEDFGRHRTTLTGHSRYCRECINRHQREHRESLDSEGLADYRRRKSESSARHPETARRSHLRNQFNITLEQYEQMYADQGGVCAICGRPENFSRKGKAVDLSVDHDHACCPEKGKSCGACVRGLLCARCNNGLGQFSDDTSRLNAAITYLGGIA